jgi:eukaryotic-like serine/threonine-protein kinase
MSLFSGIKRFVNRRLGMSRFGRVDLEKRFEISATVDQGSMSKVYWARDRQLRRMVCLKLLDKDLTASFEARYKELKRPTEGAICLGLKHRHVVETYEYGVTLDGQYYIVMEMIEGKRLDRLIKTAIRQLRGNRIKYLLQVAEGLEYVHLQRFVHRDMCPANVMINHQDLAKLIDFGISMPLLPSPKQSGNQGPTRTDLAGDLHKPVTPYMDPALFHRGLTDRRNDLFGLGVTAYETLTGKLPWDPALRVRPGGRDPREIVKDLDANTARFLMKAIHPDVDHRFQSATEMKEALGELPAC